MSGFFQKALFVALLSCSSFMLAITNNLKLHGFLVEEPCIIKPGDEAILLDFGNVPDKNLYAYGRTTSEAFSINLIECDTSIGNSVNITFSGTPSIPLPGYLALQDSSSASGFAIGIEDDAGLLLPINEIGEKLPLSDGATQLKFKAYLKGEPSAISQQQIKRGPFNAIATFKLDYE